MVKYTSAKPFKAPQKPDVNWLQPAIKTYPWTEPGRLWKLIGVSVLSEVGPVEDELLRKFLFFFCEPKIRELIRVKQIGKFSGVAGQVVTHRVVFPKLL